jgi:hypothetical protein
MDTKALLMFVKNCRRGADDAEFRGQRRLAANLRATALRTLAEASAEPRLAAGVCQIGVPPDHAAAQRERARAYAKVITQALH